MGVHTDRHLYSMDRVMKQATFTELRHAKPIADIVPIAADLPSWKRRQAQPLVLDGVRVSRLILEEREADR